MPFSENWPFKRIMVDHLLYGTTRIWWELESTFSDAGDRAYQLQASYTGQGTALDWVNVGAPANNVWFLSTDAPPREPSGKMNLTHYRVLVTTARGTYISNPAPIWGTLENKDWRLAQEIVRKERLRLGLTSIDVYLLKRFRYGIRNPSNTNPLTGGITDSQDPTSWGTAFKVGYHPPVRLQIDSSLWDQDEQRGGDNPATYSSMQAEVMPRMLAAPWLSTEDVLVDARTDQRWNVSSLKVLANWRGVPLIVQPRLQLMPHSHIVYKIPVGRDSYDVNTLFTDALPGSGTGCVSVDHDYPTDENLTYQTGECCGVEGANIMAFTKEDWDNGVRTPEHAVATSQTTANGRWAWAMQLNPGQYVIVFERPGEYGPNSVELTVTDPGPVVGSSSSLSSNSVFGAF